MNNNIIFLRHATTKFDPKKPAHKWILKDEGIEQIRKLCDDEIFHDVDIIIASDENKAIQTAYYIARKTEKLEVDTGLDGIINFDAEQTTRLTEQEANNEYYDDSVSFIQIIDLIIVILFYQ